MFPEDRPLSAQEVALTRWLLEHGVSSAARHLAELPRARVSGRCTCGCASVVFSVDGDMPEATVGIERLPMVEALIPLDGEPAR